VPAAAVIPAPRVYTKAVAVKTLVVEFQHPGKTGVAGHWGAQMLNRARPRIWSGEEKFNPKNAAGASSLLNETATNTTQTDKGGGTGGLRLP